MSTASSASRSAAISREPTPAEALASAQADEKPKISPAERWLKIREKACLLSQKHGFVGGNPLTDWKQAEAEVDAKYDTDPDGDSVSAPEQISSQINCILKRYGLDHLGVDSLLERHHQAMERLAAFDQKMIDQTAELAAEQSALAQEAVHEAVNLIQSMAHGKLSTDAMAKQANLSMQFMHNALSHLRAVTEAATGIPQKTNKDSSAKS